MTTKSLGATFGNRQTIDRMKIVMMQPLQRTRLNEAEIQRVREMVNNYGWQTFSAPASNRDCQPGFAF